MKLKSADPRFALEIVRNDPLVPYSAYTVRVSIHTEFGNFTGENTGIQVSAFPTFLEEFKKFLASRIGDATLELTEDSELRFFRWNAKGDVGVSFKLSRHAPISHFNATAPITLSGLFPLDAEHLNQLQSDFAQLTDD